MRDSSDIQNKQFSPREAFNRAAQLSAGLAKRLTDLIGPVDTAGALVGAAIETLVLSLGKSGAVSYLREVVTELEKEPGGEH